MKILNLYAGIGGNRKLWGDEHEITSVEFDDTIAAVYNKIYPNDNIVKDDALTYLKWNYDKFDFIWASPPCPSHGQYRHNVGVIGKGLHPLIPDMTSLYGIIIFLQTYFEGLWCVENVKPYYEPLVKPTVEMQRHYFWSNFPIESKKFQSSNIRTKNKISDFDDFEIIQESNIKNKRQVLRNCVLPEVGEYILESAKSYF